MANKKQTDLTGWPTQGEVMEALGVSDRTLNRMVESNKIQRQYKPVTGRRPIPVFHPGDVEKIKSQMDADRQHMMPPATSLALVRKGGEASTALVAPDQLADSLPQIAEAFSTIFAAGAASSVSKSAYVGIDEAVKISGLPKGHIQGLAKDGKLKAKKIGSWYYQRKALEEL